VRSKYKEQNKERTKVMIREKGTCITQKQHIKKSDSHNTTNKHISNQHNNQAQKRKHKLNIYTQNTTTWLVSCQNFVGFLSNFFVYFLSKMRKMRKM